MSQSAVEGKSRDSKLIENPIRFSQSKLWELQKNYFNTMGIQAWEKDIPYYITNNAFIGHHYAYLVGQLLIDWSKKYPKNTCFHILELGCGIGKFGFYFLKSLMEFIERQNIDVSFCYIMSDLSEKNVEFCRNNSSLAEYVQKGVLDFAIFDVETDTDIFLKNAQKSYAQDIKEPLIVVSNYIFDCIRHDFLNFKDNQYVALNLGLKSRFKNFDTKEVKYLNELRFDYSFEAINLDEYFEDKHLRDILNEYKTVLRDKTALMPIPIAAINFFNNINTLTNHNVVFLMGDKGASKLEVFAALDEKYRMTYEGCYTLLFNFHLMGEYVKRLGGDALLSENNNDFQVCMYSLNSQFDELPNAKLAFVEYMESLGPHEFVSFFDQSVQNAYRYSAKAIITFLRMSRWDPDAYAIIHDRLCEIIKAMTLYERINIDLDLKKIEKNIYNLAMGFEVDNLLGLLYLHLKDDEKALELFKKSTRVFHNSGTGFMNCALIYEKRKETDNALDCYKKAYAINKDDAYVKRKMLILQGNTLPVMIGPLFRLSLVISGIVAIIYLLAK